VVAAGRIQADDGMSMGIIYRNTFPVFQPGGAPAARATAIEDEFRI
jgi:hypothetical protein